MRAIGFSLGPLPPPGKRAARKNGTPVPERAAHRSLMGRAFELCERSPWVNGPGGFLFFLESSLRSDGKKYFRNKLKNYF
jgi:hypothetical protein